MTLATYDRRPWRIYLMIRRVVDFVVSATILLILSPVLIASAILIKLTSRGTVFFTQERSGKGEKRMRISKFRTMHGGRTPDSEEIGSSSKGSYRVAERNAAGGSRTLPRTSGRSSCSPHRVGSPRISPTSRPQRVTIERS